MAKAAARPARIRQKFRGTSTPSARIPPTRARGRRKRRLRVRPRRRTEGSKFTTFRAGKSRSPAGKLPVRLRREGLRRPARGRARIWRRRHLRHLRKVCGKPPRKSGAYPQTGRARPSPKTSGHSTAANLWAFRARGFPSCFSTYPTPHRRRGFFRRRAPSCSTTTTVPESSRRAGISPSTGTAAGA